MKKRDLLKALASAPAVYTLSAGASQARSSFCENNPESFEPDPETGLPGLSATCLASITDRGGSPLING